VPFFGSFFEQAKNERKAFSKSVVLLLSYFCFLKTKKVKDTFPIGESQRDFGKQPKKTA